MNIKMFLKAGLLGVLASAAVSQAHAQQVTVTIGSGGNSNSKGVVEAWCLDSGKACKVTGNRTTHAGPRSCSMSCEVNDVVAFACTSNNDDRSIDDFYVPSSASVITFSGSKAVYGAVLSGSVSASCSYTD